MERMKCLRACLGAWKGDQTADRDGGREARGGQLRSQTLHRLSALVAESSDLSVSLPKSCLLPPKAGFVLRKKKKKPQCS